MFGLIERAERVTKEFATTIKMFKVYKLRDLFNSGYTDKSLFSWYNENEESFCINFTSYFTNCPTTTAIVEPLHYGYTNDYKEFEFSLDITIGEIIAEVEKTYKETNNKKFVIDYDITKIQDFILEMDFLND